MIYHIPRVIIKTVKITTNMSTITKGFFINPLHDVGRFLMEDVMSKNKPTICRFDELISLQPVHQIEVKLVLSCFVPGIQAALN